VKQQKEHHAQNNLRNDWEMMFEEVESRE